MPIRDGYKTIDVIAQELGAPESRIRALIGLLNIQSRTFPDDRRPRYYSPEDVERIKEIVKSGR
jgi:hypothetical protein